MNKRHILVRVDGQIMPLKHAAAYCDIDYSTVRYRIRQGESVRDALLTAVRCNNPDEQNKKLSDITVEPYNPQ